MSRWCSTASAEVEPNVFFRQSDGAFRGIHRTDLYSASGQGIDRETARITKGIEHRAAGGIPAHEFPIFALVEEEARLLPRLPVHQKPEPVFPHRERHGGGAPQVTVHGAEAGVEGHGLGAFVIDGRDTAAEAGEQGVRDLQPRAVHAYRVALHHGGRAVHIDDQPGKRVALPVHEPVAGGLIAVGQPERAAQGIGCGDAVAPPRRVDLLLPEGEHPHGDGTDLKVAPGQEVARLAEHIDDGSLGDLLLAFGFHIVDGSREDPGMAPQQRLLLTPVQVDLRYHAFFGVWIWVWVCVAGGRR